MASGKKTKNNEKKFKRKEEKADGFKRRARQAIMLLTRTRTRRQSPAA